MTEPKIAATSNWNWEALKKDVCLRLDLLKASVDSMPDGELKDAVVRDLVIPNLRLLAEFCAGVKITDVEE